MILERAQPHKAPERLFTEIQTKTSALTHPHMPPQSHPTPASSHSTMSHLMSAHRPLNTTPNDPLRGELPSHKTILGQRTSDALSNTSDSAKLYNNDNNINHSAGTQRRKLGMMIISIPVNCLPMTP